MRNVALGVQAFRWGGALALALWSTAVCAQNTRATNLVASFEAAPNRPLIAPMHGMQAYGGFAGDVSLNHFGEAFALPLGGGTGLSRKTELGIDTAVGLLPLQPLARFRAYGRMLLIEDITAVQVGLWSPIRRQDPLGIEAMVPARLHLGRLHLFGQAKALYQIASFEDILVTGAALTSMYEVVGPVYSGIDLGTALQITGVNRLYPESLMGLALAGHTGVRVLSNTFVKLRYALPNLMGTDPETGVWNGYSEQVVDLMVVQSLDFRRSKDSTAAPAGQTPE